MGLFGGIKRALGGGGGVRLKLEAPKSFTWDDQQLALMVALTGHKSEAREIERIEFQLKDKPEEQGNNNSRDSNSSHSSYSQSGLRVDYLWDFVEPFELRAGQSKTLEILMPLPFTSTASTPIVESEAVGGILGKVLGAVSTGPPTDVRYYELSAKTHMTDVKGTANANRPIRYGGAFRSSSSIGGFKIT